MVVLHGKMKETKARWVACGGASQREPNRREYVLAAERGEMGAQRDVDRLARAVAWAGAVRNVAALPTFAPGTAACAAPACGKRQCELLRETLTRRFARP